MERSGVGLFGDDLGAEGLAEQLGVVAGVVLEYRVVLADRIRLVQRFLIRVGWRGPGGALRLLGRSRCLGGTALARGLRLPVRGLRLPVRAASPSAGCARSAGCVFPSAGCVFLSADGSAVAVEA